jgi:hypothetical protein
MPRATGIPILRNDLAYFGVVSQVTSATVFSVQGLAGHGNEAFAGPNPYSVYVLWDAGGAGRPPQGEEQTIANYVSTNGVFTISAAFTTPLAVGDHVLVLHPFIAMANNILISNIFGIVNALLVTSESGGTLTADGTEQNVYISNTPASLFEPIIVNIDCTNMAAGDIVILRLYYRIAPGGNLIMKDEITLNGPQTPALKNIGLEYNRFGVQVTLEQTAGVNRDFDWEAIMGI